MRLWLLAVVGASWLAAWLAGAPNLSTSVWYGLATSLLLAVGLFGSTAGINLAEAREHRRLILAAVTIGVLLKAAIIGGVLFLAARDPLFLVLGVAVAQIDPLSVASLMGDKRMSPKAKTILAAWASFDDPVTVILVVYAAAFAGGLGFDPSGLGAYGLNLLLNAALAGAAYLAWRFLRPPATTSGERPRAPRSRAKGLALAFVLAVLAVVAVWQFLMLGVAIAGLFVRPAWLDRLLPRVTNTALLVSGALLGLLLVNGVIPGYGALLGVMAFVAQIVAGILLTRGLPRPDRVHLALAQQNGITAIILALRLETQFTSAVAIIAPAILTTNVVHFAANWLADRRATPKIPLTGEISEDPRKSHR